LSLLTPSQVPQSLRLGNFNAYRTKSSPLLPVPIRSAR
jgi:hypothetical protein